MYRPEMHFNVAMKILVPTWENVQGVNQKVYPNPEDVNDDFIFFGNFKTYGGTESVSNGVLSIVDTANIDTWYRPDITADCRIYVLSTKRTYDVISEPENVEMRNELLKFKVKRVGGKA